MSTETVLRTRSIDLVELPDLVEFVKGLASFASRGEYDYLDDLSVTLDRDWVEWQVSEMASKHLR